MDVETVETGWPFVGFVLLPFSVDVGNFSLFVSSVKLFFFLLFAWKTHYKNQLICDEDLWHL